MKRATLESGRSKTFKCKLKLTLITSIARNSTSFHVFPTENVPLEFILDLWMRPSPPAFPGVDYSIPFTHSNGLGVRANKMNLGLRSASVPASSRILRWET